MTRSAQSTVVHVNLLQAKGGKGGTDTQSWILQADGKSAERLEPVRFVLR